MILAEVATGIVMAATFHTSKLSACWYLVPTCSSFLPSWDWWRDCCSASCLHAVTHDRHVTDQANISNNAAVAVLVLICIFVSGWVLRLNLSCLRHTCRGD